MPGIDLPSRPPTPPISFQSPYIAAFESTLGELSEKKRTRGISAAASISNELQHGPSRQTYLSILDFASNDPIRLRKLDTRSPQRCVAPPRPIPLRNTMPEAAVPLRRQVGRHVVSSPAVFGDHAPASPMGNAFSGEHFWAPQFRPRTRPVGTPPAPKDPVSRATYDEVLCDVKAFTARIRETKSSTVIPGIVDEGGGKTGFGTGDGENNGMKCRTPNNIAASSCQALSDAAAGALAASQVLALRNAEFALGGSFPSPSALAARLEQLYADETRVLHEYSINSPAEMTNIDQWLSVHDESLEFRTLLDHAREVLRMARERRKSGDLALSLPEWGMVWAVRLWEEKDALAREEDESSSESEGDEYGRFLKSVAEEMGNGGVGKAGAELEDDGTGDERVLERERVLREKMTGEQNAIGKRRLKGKAPSALDLAEWAAELRRMEENAYDSVTTKKL